MSILESNTEELREVLQQVYNLPMGGGGSSEPDLVVALDATGTGSLHEINESHISIERGNVADVIAKIKGSETVNVLLKLLTFYAGNPYYQSFYPESVGAYVLWGEDKLVIQFDLRFYSNSLDYSGVGLIVITPDGGITFDRRVEATPAELEDLIKQSSEPDLVIGMNASGQNIDRPGYYTEEDISIESGSVLAVVEKVKQGVPVRVVLKDIQFYNETQWSRGIAEATYVSLIIDGDEHPSENYKYLSIGFNLLSCPFGFTWDSDYPAIVHFVFDAVTGEIVRYSFGLL